MGKLDDKEKILKGEQYVICLILGDKFKLLRMRKIYAPYVSRKMNNLKTIAYIACRNDRMKIICIVHAYV